jgi:hypothetical protein
MSSIPVNDTELDNRWRVDGAAVRCETTEDCRQNLMIACRLDPIRASLLLYTLKLKKNKPLTLVTDAAHARLAGLLANLELKVAVAEATR